MNPSAILHLQAERYIALANTVHISVEKWMLSTSGAFRDTLFFEQTMKKTFPLEKRKTFRHGDLRNALIAAGLEMARTGGPN